MRHEKRSQSQCQCSLVKGIPPLSGNPSMWLSQQSKRLLTLPQFLNCLEDCGYKLSRRLWLPQRIGSLTCASIAKKRRDGQWLRLEDTRVSCIWRNCWSRGLDFPSWPRMKTEVTPAFFQEVMWIWITVVLQSASKNHWENAAAAVSPRFLEMWSVWWNASTLTSGQPWQADYLHR